MNTNLEKLNQETDLMKEQLNENLISKWAHQGYSDYILDTIDLIKVDIYLFEEDNIENYNSKTDRIIILSKLRAIFNDTKNLLLSRDMLLDVTSFIKNFLILVNNWNMMNIEDQNISSDIEAILRIFEIQGTIVGAMQRLNHSAMVIQEYAQKMNNNNEGKAFKTSLTYLEAIKDSLKDEDDMNEEGQVE